MSTEPLEVEVWSDIACPWCWVGSKNLADAQELFGGKVNVTWRAFQLDPNGPAETGSTVSYLQRLATKYRVPEAEAQACLLYTSPSPRDKRQSRMPSSA